MDIRYYDTNFLFPKKRKNHFGGVFNLERKNLVKFMNFWYSNRYFASFFIKKKIRIARDRNY